MFFNSHGVLGINARNLLYIRPYNKKKAIKLADDKLKTKSFLSARGIPVPRLFGVIRRRSDLEKFDFSALPNSFVLKPNQGAGGEGIMPIWEHHDGRYFFMNGQSISQDEMEEHIADILDGRFSISGITDQAFFEQLLICDERLARFAHKGLPDIRVVVYNLVPVMAMLRLPTRKSAGKANLHQGAVGVGIDIAKGEATHVVQGTKVVEEIPEAGEIRGLKIPYWDEILHISSKVQLETNLGYLAVDIAIDQNTGPVLLEINARAGLGVQIANLAPLQRRLERIQGIKVTNPEKGVRLAKDMFGNVIEKGIKHLTGREVIGVMEPVKILVGVKPFRLVAHLNPNIEKTQIDIAYAHEIGLLKENESVDSKKIKFILGGRRVQTIASFVNLDIKEIVMVVGRRDLQGFLLDPSRGAKPKGIEALPSVVERTKEEEHEYVKKKNFRLVDDALYRIDQQIKLLYHLRPLNLDGERERFFKGEVKNPQFVYSELLFDPIKLREQLYELSIDDSALGRLFERKRLEIVQKIDLLEHRGTSYFGDESAVLFGSVSEEMLTEAQARLAERPRNFPAEKVSISTEQAIHHFQKVFDKYGLENWRVKTRKGMVADCVAGKKGSFFIREGVTFTETRLRMVVAHEIETHILTAENGKHQPYKIFQRGTGNYLTTQEGLAIYNQEQVVESMTEKHFWNAALVVMVYTAQTDSFGKVFDKALAMGYDKTKAFQFALKVKRGFEDTGLPGAFTKDLIYFRGKRMIGEFVANGGDLKRLYIGKIDLPSLEEIEQLSFLSAPKFYPKWYAKE